MAATPGAAPLTGGVALLERAVSYLMGSLPLVTPETTGRPTPCHGWDLATLLDHLDDSLAALHEAVDLGRVEDRAAVRQPAADPVTGLRVRAGQLLGAWAGASGPDRTLVAGWPVTASLMSAAGAVELAVHGWDVAQACGRARPIPASLADELLDLSPLLITDTDRPDRFAAPVSVASGAGPADRLLAFLGRDPH